MADSGFASDVRYDLSFFNNEFLTTIRVDLVGDDPVLSQMSGGRRERAYGTTRPSSVTEPDCTKSSSIFVCGWWRPSDGERACGNGPNEHDELVSDNPSGWPNDKHDEIAAHEVGHMFGNFDE